MNFAKIFQIDADTQVLVMRSTDDEEEDSPCVLEKITDFDSVRVTVKLSFQEQEDCVRAFDAFDHNKAIAFRTSISKMFK